MSELVNFDRIDVITCGAVGEPGRRTFYLQIRSADRDITIRCEKQQVATISQYLRRALVSLPVPEGQPPRSVMQLHEQFDEAFVLGAVALEFNTAADHFVLHLREFSEDLPDDIDDSDLDDDDDDDDSDDDDESRDDLDGERALDPFGDDAGADLERVRVVMTRAQAVAFCDHTDRVVASGRPVCVYCELPINPDGHFCPRMN